LVPGIAVNVFILGRSKDVGVSDFAVGEGEWKMGVSDEIKFQWNFLRGQMPDDRSRKPIAPTTMSKVNTQRK
jgi:hypothetical protein